MERERVYLAGKIRMSCWRHLIFSNLRGARKPFEENSQIYVGPFFISCDHGCYHGENLHGVDASKNGKWGKGCFCDDIPPQTYKKTLKKCKNQILSADKMFVWIDKDFNTAYGTHAEMGIAYAAGIPIYIAQNESISPKKSKNWWFLSEMATAFCTVKSAKEGYYKIFSWWK